MKIVIIIVFLLIALADFPFLIKQKQWYEFAIVSLFFLSAFILAMLQSFGVAIPSPIKEVEYILRDVLHLTYS